MIIYKNHLCKNVGLKNCLAILIFYAILEYLLNFWDYNNFIKYYKYKIFK